MSGYLVAHGHTMTVDLVVSNERELYDRYQIILDGVESAVDDGMSLGDHTTQIETAAADYRAMVRGLDRRKYSDLVGVNLDKVDWFGLIRSDLSERAR